MRSRALGLSLAIVALAAVGCWKAPETHAQDGPAIVGRVTDGEGRGIPDAHVTLSEPLGIRARDDLTAYEELVNVRPPFAETRTDRGGSFRLPVPRRGLYNVTAAKDGFASAAASYLTVEREDVMVIDLVLGPERLLVAEIQDPAGSPVPGAEVVTWFPMHGGGRVKSLTSDARGRFTLSSPRTGMAEGPVIQAVRTGVGIGSETFRMDELPEILMVRLFKTRTLTCRFVPDDGSPAPSGLRFGIRTSILPREFRFVRQTDERGDGIVSDLPEVDRVAVLTDDPRWCLPWPGAEGNAYAYVTTGRTRAVPSTGDATLNIPVIRTGSVSGTVIDHTSGRPVPGVPIAGVTWGSAQVPRGRNYRVNAVSDAEGRFRLSGLQRADLEIVPLSTRWLAWAGDGGGPRPGWGRTPVHSLKTDAALDDVTVEVVESGTVEGIARDADGNPLVAARVDPGFELWDWRNTVVIDDETLLHKSTTTTDSAGRFRLTAVDPGPLRRIRVWSSNLPTAWSAPFELAPGGAVDGITVSLVKGRTLLVEVIGPGGVPVPGVGLYVREQQRPQDPGSCTTLQGNDESAFSRKTDERGIATFPSFTRPIVMLTADPRPAGLQVDPSFVQEVVLAPGDTTRVTVKLVPEIFLRGQVVLENGSLIGEASLSAQAGRFETTGYPRAGSGRIAADGTFAIGVPSAGDYEVSEIARGRYVPTGVGATTEMKYDVYVPVAGLPLRTDQTNKLVVRRR